MPNEVSVWVQSGAIGLLAFVLFGLAKVIWWILPKAFETHAMAIKDLTSGQKATVEMLIAKNEKDMAEERSRCDEQHAAKDRIISDVMASVQTIAESQAALVEAAQSVSKK